MTEPLQTIDPSLILKYFTGEATAEEAAAVRLWIAADEENRRTADAVARIAFAAQTMAVASEVDTEAALKRVHARMTSDLPARRLWLRRAQQAAALLFLPLLVATITLVFSNRGTERYVEMATNPGMTTCVTLPDSTRVWLNSESRIKYPSRFGRTRRVELQGEAYFEVERTEGRRFVVETCTGVQVEVLGTRFNVDAYDPQAVSATLVSGSVAFNYDDAAGEISRMTLKPGQRAVYTAATRTALLREVDTDTYTAWKDGRILFRQTSLDEVLRVLSRRFNVEFQVRDPKLLGQHFTGVFVHQRLDRVLEHFAVSSGIHYRYLPVGEREKSRIEIY